MLHIYIADKQAVAAVDPILISRDLDFRCLWLVKDTTVFTA